jgi:hypothetical protein
MNGTESEEPLAGVSPDSIKAFSREEKEKVCKNSNLCGRVR